MKATRHGDIGTPELPKRKGLKIVVVDGQPKARVSNVSPIQTMYERGYLTISQFSAGQKLYNCWVVGWGEYNSYEIKERTNGGVGRELTTRKLIAMQEFDKGIKAAGKEKDLITQVVLQETPMTQRGMNGYRIAQLRYRLRRALDDIAHVYGF